MSIVQLQANDAKNMGSLSCFDAIENTKGVQVITPSLGFRVINTRGFSNTTNVRFTQLVDGIDNQAPHIGAPIANSLGANDLDIDKIELVPGTASALYGMNAINGLANIRTKDPFIHQGFSVQQLTGVNHLGRSDQDAKLFSQTNLRYAKAYKSKLAFKITIGYTDGSDWVADDRTDLAPTLNASTGLLGTDNPAYDEVNGYGNESSNRKTLSLNGKNYVVARTGYLEREITDYSINNFKGDIGVYYRPKKGHELSLSYKDALINSQYQRSNRFRMENYTLQQFSLDYQSEIVQIKAYLTLENTGKSYNLRSLAENMDRSFKSDNQWFSDYTTAFNNATAGGLSVVEAHSTARNNADNGRYEPGSAGFEQKKNELIEINNWDYGAALRVKANLAHTEGLIHWDKLFPELFTKWKAQLLSGFDYRSYFIVPDGNYFINPGDSTHNLIYSKAGGFVQLSKDLCKNKLRLSATLRADKADYFDWKLNPRFTIVYSPTELLHVRSSYQSGYRFPSIFEGFSNVNSGGVKRVGGLKIMSDGIFENSYTKASIDAFQAQVTTDINTNGLTQSQAIEQNKALLKKNPYTYLKPEYVRSFEIGVRGLALKKSLFLDADFYFNSYDNFIAQVEASVPNTTDQDSIPTYLYTKSKQSRYRLWTNSQSKIYSYGASLGLKYACNSNISIAFNMTYTKLQRTDNKDGLEDGFNTPALAFNSTIVAKNIWNKIGGSVTGRYQTKFDYVSFLVSGEVPAYWSLDAQLNYTFDKPGIIAKAGATNLLNKYYATILGGPSIGAMYYLSLTWKLKD
ncbi:MAG: TonB-dependent receptor [Fluviicola sp.]|nr:TonB-dependent receptor [Fluviicola sp.]